jgi:hypothetical protein
VTGVGLILAFAAGSQVLASRLRIPAITCCCRLASCVRTDHHDRFKIIKWGREWQMAGPWIDQPTGSFGDIGSSESAQVQMARLVSAAMILNPDQVLTLDLPSSYSEG